jgi:hypothetical protein
VIIVSIIQEPPDSNGAKLRQPLTTVHVGDYSLHHPGTSRFQWSKTKATFNNVHVGDYSLYHPGTSRFQWSKTKATFNNVHVGDYSLQIPMEQN